MINLTTSSVPYDNYEMHDIRCIPTADNKDDAHTKIEINRRLEELSDSGLFVWKVSQWIIRNGKTDWT